MIRYLVLFKIYMHNKFYQIIVYYTKFYLYFLTILNKYATVVTSAAGNICLKNYEN